MDLRLSAEQRQLVDAFASLYAKHSAPELVRAAEKVGFDPGLWSRLGELGVVAMAVDEAAGGWGASLLDLALVAEQQGRAVAPVPAIECQVAARLLARLGPDGADPLAGALSGDRSVTFAPARARDGVAGLVPAGSVADDAIVLAGDQLLLVPLEGHRRVVENLASMPLADVQIPASAIVLASGPTAVAAHDHALDEWLALTASALVGVAARALEIGVEYVKERKAWDVPIATFQAVSHRLADSAAAVDGARLLSEEAAWAASEQPDRAAELAAMAFAFAYETARDTSYWSLHFHGGYGFMMEYDIQLHYRRARGWANVFDNPEALYRRAAERRYGSGDPARPGSARSATAPTSDRSGDEPHIDFRLGPRTEEFRAEVRAFLDEQMTVELEEKLYRSGVSNDEGFTRALAERGWLALSWPVEWGGQGRDPLDQMVFQEEIQRRDAPFYGIGTTMMVAKVIHNIGTDEQKDAILRRALAGEIIICLGFSEPEAGSDVYAAQTRAVRDGDEWVIDGQKMFTTNAHIGDYVFLLARSNTEVAKHRGLTTFLVPLDHPGVEVQAVYTLSGERTNITYYSGVRIADAWRIGEVDGGLAVMSALLQDEHSAGFSARLRSLVDHVEVWARETVGPDGAPRIDDGDVRRRLGRAATEAEVSTLLQRRSAWMAAAGVVPVAEGPMSKLYSSEALERTAQDLTELIGPDALRSYFEPTAPQGGRIEHLLRFSLGTTIYAGTSEVQRNIIAQRGLGLPR